MCQVAPPSIVQAYVPLLPLTHATFVLTALTPRKLADVPLACAFHKEPGTYLASPGVLVATSTGTRQVEVGAVERIVEGLMESDLPTRRRKAQRKCEYTQAVTLSSAHLSDLHVQNCLTGRSETCLPQHAPTEFPASHERFCRYLVQP